LNLQRDKNVDSVSTMPECAKRAQATDRAIAAEALPGLQPQTAKKKEL